MPANALGKTYHDIDLKEVEELAAGLVSEYNIATLLGYNRTYWPELKRQYPELSEAIFRGRSRSEKALAAKLIERAMVDKSDACLLFALKSQHKWRDTQEVEITHRVEELNSAREERMARIQESQQKLISNKILDNSDVIDVSSTDE